MIISVASGKGGTGKTTISTSLALSLENSQYLDCDVEEPNGHLFLKPRLKQRQSVFIKLPEIDENKCTYCGNCVDICQFNALVVVPNKVLLFDQLCHGCGACSILCPEKAIRETDKEIGILEMGYTGEMPFAHGIVNIGESMVTPVIRELIEQIEPDRTAILDAPPGTNCPVVETVRSSDYCILVTEATPFGLNDLKLAVDMLQDLHVKHGVIVNKSDLGTDLVERYCEEKNIPVLLQIPFSRDIAVGYSKGEMLTETKSEYKIIFQRVFERIKEEVHAGAVRAF